MSENKMEKPEAVSPEQQSQPSIEKPTPFEVFMSNPKVQEAIAQMPSLIERYFKSRAKLITLPVASLIFGVIIVIIASVVFLTIKNKLSSDVISFLLGTIIGASFTFLEKFLPSR